MATGDYNYFSQPTTVNWPNTNWQTNQTWTYPVYDSVLTRAQAIAAALDAKAITRKEAREALKSLGAPFAAILA